MTNPFYIISADYLRETSETRPTASGLLQWKDLVLQTVVLVKTYLYKGG